MAKNGRKDVSLQTFVKMIDLNKIFVFRMTHIENIPHILQYGITHHTSANRNPKFIPIGDNDLINTRSEFLLKNGNRLGNYIPFYFATRTPMLYVIQKGFNKVLPTPSENIVYCATTIQNIIDANLDFVFTDGHAVNSFTSQYSAVDVQNINDFIDWNAVKAQYWKIDSDLDLKRRKEAEFLILGDIPIAAIVCFYVFNQSAQTKLISFGASPLNIQIQPNLYF